MMNAMADLLVTIALTFKLHTRQGDFGRGCSRIGPVKEHGL